MAMKLYASGVKYLAYRAPLTLYAHNFLLQTIYVCFVQGINPFQGIDWVIKSTLRNEELNTYTHTLAHKLTRQTDTHTRTRTHN